MNKISYCGHDCSRCVTYAATKNNDDSLRKRSQKFYSEKPGNNVPLSEFNCLGCKSDTVFKPCLGCPFKKCCADKGIEACDECPQYPCALLKDYQKRHVNKSNQL